MLTSCLGNAGPAQGRPSGQIKSSPTNRCQKNPSKLASRSTSDENLDTSCSSSTHNSNHLLVGNHGDCSLHAHQLSPSATNMIHSDNSIYSLINTDNNNNQLHSSDDGRYVKPKQNQYKPTAAFHHHHQDVPMSMHHHDQHDSQLRPMLLNNQDRNQTEKSLNRNQEQHRRLQYQVHQQLQKIYSNKLQEFEQHNQIQLQRQPATSNNQSKPMQKGPANSNSDMIKIHQLHHNHHHQHCQNNQHLYQEEAYDSLSLSPHTESGQKQQLPANNTNEDFYDIQPNRRASISAIPEECYEDEPDPRRCHNHHSNHLHHHHHHHNHDNHLDDDNDDQDDDKEELLVASSNEEAPVTLSKLTRAASLDRKRQLESLHYATATAAALLNVTANAAAAFAAVQEGKTNSGQRKQSRPVYTETYQDIGSTKQQGPYQAISSARNVRHPRHQLQRQPSNKPPVYATASDRHDLYQAHRRLPTYPAPPIQQQQARFQVNNFAPGQSIYQIDPNRAKPRTAPPNMLSPQQLELLRWRQRQMQFLIQQQQQQQLQSQNQQAAFIQQQQQQQQKASVESVPTLAILHPGPKGSPLRVDLIARMPINQMVQQQINQLQLQQQQQQRAPLARPDQRLALANVNPKPSQGPIYGLIESGDRLKQQLAAAVHRPFIPVQAITSAPSDASGHSHVPLVIDRKVNKPGLLERICRIDLKLFWWSLIIVCGMFIAAVLTITRNVFS